MSINISTLKQLRQFSKDFALTLKSGDVIYLYGDLGSGKTTFTQLLLKELGYNKRVKSPTYAIYESYHFNNYNIYHMDLYRLSSPEELYYLGIEDIFTANNIVFIEWPKKGLDVIPQATKILKFELVDATTRRLNLETT